MDDLLCNESVISQSSSSGGGSNHHHNAGEDGEELFPVCAYDTAIYNDERVLENLVIGQHHHLPSAAYLQPNKSNVTTNIRGVLVNWMLELCEHRSCEDQVFIVAVNLLDRFLGCTVIQRSQLQLTACVCLLISSKIRQCTYLTVELLAFYTEDSVSHSEIRQWEVLVLAKLGWNMSPVTSVDFIEPLFSLFPQLHGEGSVRKHAFTYITLAATEGEFVDLLPAVVAGAAVSVALDGLALHVPDAVPRMASFLKCSTDEILSSRQLIELAIHRYSEHMNLVNNNNNEVDANHFLGETKMSMDSNSSKIDGKVTPTDIVDIEF